MNSFVQTVVIYFPIVFWLAVIVGVITLFRRRSFRFSKKVREFDFELSQRGTGWIKIQPLEAVHIEEVTQWDARKQIISLKDGTQKKVHKVRAVGMDKELEFVRNQLGIKSS